MSSFIGQFHPLLVHLPIGILLVAMLFKWLSSTTGGSKYQAVIPQLLLFAAGSALFTAISGYLLSLSGAYDEGLVNNHQWSGFGLTLMIAILYFIILKNKSVPLQNISWLICGGLLWYTGHKGGSLTHGEDYLKFSTSTYTKPIITNMDEAMIYPDIIQPIFAQKCWSCHSSKKQKGDLRLDDIKYVMQGGEHGKVIDAGTAKSKLYTKLTLPDDDDDHMPPEGKPQPSDAEIQLIAWWINSGAPTDKKIHELNPTPEIKNALSEIAMEDQISEPSTLPEQPISPANQSVIDQLLQSGIVLIPVSQQSNYLSVNINHKLLTNQQWTLLKEINKNIVWLKATHQVLNDTLTAQLGLMENLYRLDLRSGKIRDIHSLTPLAALKHLRSLNLSQTNVSPDHLTPLQPLKELLQLYVFDSGIQPAQLVALKNIWPSAVIDIGNYRVPVLHGDTSEFTRDEYDRIRKADSISHAVNRN